MELNCNAHIYTNVAKTCKKPALESIASTQRKYHAFMSCWAINRKATDSKLSGSTMFAERNEVEVTTPSGQGLRELNSRHGEPWNTTWASFAVLLLYFSTDNLRVVQLGSIFPFSEWRHLSICISIELGNNWLFTDIVLKTPINVLRVLWGI